MDLILPLILVAIVGVLSLQVMRLVRKLESQQHATTPGAPSINEITAQVQLATQQSLSDALDKITAQARHDREESIRIATDNIAKSGGEQLGTRAQLIDNTLKNVADQMSKRLDDLSIELNRLRETNNTQYTNVEKAVEALSQRTDNLNEVLSNSQKRGQWGERVVEDMLRAAGFIENINYSKQDQDEEKKKPDYKLMMPPNRVLLMDVKFPLDQYALHFQATNDQLRTQAKNEFVKAVKGHVDALAKRDYINNAKEEALDYVLMFLPNESISGFVHEADPTLIDYALNKKVVLCSPLTLYAFLVVVRQATDSFHTEQTAASIMQQINKFNGEWDKYVKAVDDVKVTFSKFTDKLEEISTDGTRFNKLAVPVRAIEKLRKKQGIPELTEGSETELELGDE